MNDFTFLQKLKNITIFHLLSILIFSTLNTRSDIELYKQYVIETIESRIKVYHKQGFVYVTTSILVGKRNNFDEFKSILGGSFSVFSISNASIYSSIEFVETFSKQKETLAEKNLIFDSFTVKVGFIRGRAVMKGVSLGACYTRYALFDVGLKDFISRSLRTLMGGLYVEIMVFDKSGAFIRSAVFGMLNIWYSEQRDVAFVSNVASKTEKLNLKKVFLLGFHTTICAVVYTNIAVLCSFKVASEYMPLFDRNVIIYLGTAGVSFSFF